MEVFLPARMSPANLIFNAADDWTKSDSFVKCHLASRINFLLFSTTAGVVSCLWHTFVFTIKTPLCILKYTIFMISIKGVSIGDRILPKGFEWDEVLKHAYKVVAFVTVTAVFSPAIGLVSPGANTRFHTAIGIIQLEKKPTTPPEDVETGTTGDTPTGATSETAQEGEADQSDPSVTETGRDGASTNTRRARKKRDPHPLLADADVIALLHRQNLKNNYNDESNEADEADGSEEFGPAADHDRVNTDIRKLDEMKAEKGAAYKELTQSMSAIVLSRRGVLPSAKPLPASVRDITHDWTS